MTTLAFDVYGTLINTSGVVTMLRRMVCDQAESFSRLWRDKQLEYAFRRGLMQRYEDFSICTSHALDYACDYLKAPLSAEQKQALLNEYLVLPAFDDVKGSLERLQADGHSLYAFSNGHTDAVDALLNHANIRDCSGLIAPETLIRDNLNPILRCQYESETTV